MKKNIRNVKASQNSNKKTNKDIHSPLKEEKKVEILLAQLKIANEKWIYMEERRLKTLELFLSYSGISVIGLLFTIDIKIDAALSNAMQNILPIFFGFIGLIFFILYWYREYYYQLTKSWCKRIEQELRIIYKNKLDRRKEDFDGAYRIYYYRTNFDDINKKYQDWSSYVLGIAIAFTTIVVSFVCYNRFNPEFLFSSKAVHLFFASLIIFWGTREIILNHLNKMYRDHRKKSPPKLLKKKKKSRKD